MKSVLRIGLIASGLVAILILTGCSYGKSGLVHTTGAPDTSFMAMQRTIDDLNLEVARLKGIIEAQNTIKRDSNRDKAGPNKDQGDLDMTGIYLELQKVNDSLRHISGQLDALNQNINNLNR